MLGIPHFVLQEHKTGGSQ